MTPISMATLRKYTGKAVAALVQSRAHSATIYVSPKQTVVATRKFLHKKLPGDRYSIEIALTVGRPNYRSRAFIKTALKAGEPFPIKKVQLTFPRR